MREVWDAVWVRWRQERGVHPFVAVAIHRTRNRQKRRQMSSLLFGGHLEYRTSHWAARMIWRNVFGKTSILGGWWLGVVGTRWSSIFLKHPFCQASVLLRISILFFKSSWCKICSVWVTNTVHSLPQKAATTFAFSSVCFFFFGGGMWPVHTKVCSIILAATQFQVNFWLI